MDEELTPQARSARATYLLIIRPPMTTGELVESLGVDRHAVYKIMDNLSLAGVPVYQPEKNYWTVEGGWAKRVFNDAGLVHTAASRGVPDLE